MKLTPQQIAAAKARGFTIFPATRDQVERMTMQRRVFLVDDRPHVVSRDGLYFETHATLAPVLKDVPAEAPPPARAPVPEPAHQPMPEPMPEPAVADAAPEVPSAEMPDEPAEADGPARRRAPRRRAVRTEAPAEPSPELPLPEPTRPDDPENPIRRRGGGRRRTGQQEPQRWQVAGALRRGRTPRI